MKKENKEKLKKAEALIRESVRNIEAVYTDIMNGYLEMSESAQDSERGEKINDCFEHLAGVSLELSLNADEIAEYLK